MQTNNQNSNSPINPKLGSSVTNAIKNAEAGELPALDDISNITNRVVEKIKASENILIALSKNPNIDEISAALGLAMILDTMRKHVTAIFSGQVPNVLQFLKPEETFEKTTNSLQDFIIALSKDKVDHISYKIEGDFVKVYVTPYKATIGQADLSMSHGDYNVDLVICFNVISGDEIDPALSEYGRIMHDATAINLTVDTPGRFAELEWQDSNVSSISEMIVGLADRLGLASFSEQVATALLTGIVASTDHFSNPRTSSNTMSIASKLMSFGANQQLISSQIMEKIKTPADPAAPVTPAVPATPAVTVGSAPVESIPVSDSPLDYIEIEPNPNQTLDGQPLESQSTPAAQSLEPQISPTPQPQEPQSASQAAPVSQSFESQPTPTSQAIESQSAPTPQSLEPQQAPVYHAPINPAAAAASAVMENNFIQNPEPSLPQPNYTNETPNYQAPVMPTPPLNFAQNLAAPQSVSAPFAAPVSIAAPAPLAQPTPLAAPIPQEQPMQYSAPVQQTQPVQSIQPTQFVQPTQYPESVSPVQPMQFTAPVPQAQPMPYVEPMQPTPMAAPVEPVQFAQPVQPMASVPPVQPMESIQSMPPVPPAPVIFDAASMPNQPLANDQAFINSVPVDLMPPMPPEAPSTPDVDFFAQAAAATEAAQANPAPISPAPVEPPLRTFASDSPLISQPVDTTAPAAAPIAEPAAIFSPEEPTEPAPAKIDPTAFHIPGM